MFAEAPPHKSSPKEVNPQSQAIGILCEPEFAEWWERFLYYTLTNYGGIQHPLTVILDPDEITQGCDNHNVGLVLLDLRKSDEPERSHLSQLVAAAEARPNHISLLTYVPITPVQTHPVNRQVLIGKIASNFQIENRHVYPQHDVERLQDTLLAFAQEHMQPTLPSQPEPETTQETTILFLGEHDQDDVSSLLTTANQELKKVHQQAYPMYATADARTGLLPHAQDLALAIQHSQCRAIVVSLSFATSHFDYFQELIRKTPYTRVIITRKSFGLQAPMLRARLDESVRNRLSFIQLDANARQLATDIGQALAPEELKLQTAPLGQPAPRLPVTRKAVDELIAGLKKA